MTPFQILVLAWAVVTVVAYGTVFLVLPAAYVLMFGRPETFEHIPRWKLPFALPYLGIGILIVAMYEYCFASEIDDVRAP